MAVVAGQGIVEPSRPALRGVQIKEGRDAEQARGFVARVVAGRAPCAAGIFPLGFGREAVGHAFTALRYALGEHRLGYLHVVAGGLRVGREVQLHAGDGLRFTHHEALSIAATSPDTEVLLFDL